MDSFPLDKYNFYVVGHKVIAVSTYCGRRVRGVAKCSTDDTFDIEKGKKLAAARCNLRIAEKRAKRAQKKFNEAMVNVEKAQAFQTKMLNYRHEALMSKAVAKREVEDMLREF